MAMRPLLLAIFITNLFLSCVVAQDTLILDLPKEVQQILETRCLECHSENASEGSVNLETLGTHVPPDPLELLNQLQEQVYFRHMPPEDESPLTANERNLLLDWAGKTLRVHSASKLEDKLRRPDYGNYVDHQQLFSGDFVDLKGFTYDRRWLISEFIFDARFNQILNHHPFKTIDGEREYVIGDNNRRVNLTNPFLLPPRSGVRYYANETLNGGHLLTMITNAKEVSTNMVYLVTRDQQYIPAIAEIMDLQWEHDKILASRELFLNRFMDRTLKDIYGDEHTSLLPKFVPIEVSQNESSSDPTTKKAPFHAANPGRVELILIYQTMQIVGDSNETEQQMINKCEEAWFYAGDHPRKIAARITFLNNYMEEFREQIERHRYAERNKLPIYKPLADEEMEEIRKTIKLLRQKGDRYNAITRKCRDYWRVNFETERTEAGPPTDQQWSELTGQLYDKILERPPTKNEAQQLFALAKRYVTSMGNQKAIEKLIQTCILNSDFVYRQEFGAGEADTEGRRMMSPRDASYALAYALSDSSPDKELKEAAEQGRLVTRSDYEREVRRLLARRDQYYVIDEAVERIQLTASITNLPIRKLRFFREFFGYPQLLPIFKDNKRFGGDYDKAKGRLVSEADRLVEHILQNDRHVFEELLTTDGFYVFHSGDNKAMTIASDRIRSIYEYFHPLNWEDFETEDLLEHKEFLEKVKMRGVNIDQLGTHGRRNSLREFKVAMASFTLRFNKGQTAAAPFVSFPAHGPYNASTRTGKQLRSPEVAKFFNIKLDNWNYPSTQPAPVSHRKGMLTHPAWLIAHAHNTETDPIRRGKWVREKLLAGTVPDLPITIDAVISEDPHRTLRERLETKTQQEYCWQCHKQMNPLGLPFEMFDDFGRYRTQESLEYPENLVTKGPDKAAVHVDLRDIYTTRPVNSAGYLRGTGDPQLDGDVDNAIDLIEKLAKSERVRQSLIRHAFRYFLGRNETLADSKTLIDADQAYLQNDGSFDAVIISLLTSDSFIYRKSLEE